MQLTLNILTTDFTSETPLVVTTGGISINGELNLTDSGTLTVEVEDGFSADIVVSQAGYLPYTMSIDNVYCDDRLLYIILLAEITDISDPNYSRPRPSFFTFNDSCTYCFDYYSASSGGGRNSWYVNNELYKQDVSQGKSCFCNPGEFQLKLRTTWSNFITEGVDGFCPQEVLLWDQQYANIYTGNTVAQIIDPIEDYLALDTETNLTISEYKVAISLEVQTTVAPQKDENSCCYVRDEEVLIVPSVEISRFGSVNSDYTLTWKVVDPTGLTMGFNQSVFSLDSTVPNISLPFTLSKLGVYTVTTTVEDLQCGNTFVEMIEVETCNFIEIKSEDCNTYKVYNRSSQYDITYELNDVVNPNEVVSTGSIPYGSTMNFTFATPSIYLLTIRYTKDDAQVEETYVMNNYCSIEACFSAYIEEILCGPTERCAPCPPESDLNQMLLFYNAYFMKMNSFFQINSYFTALDQSTLDDLTNAVQLMEKIMEFCKRNNCLGGDSGAFNGSFIAEGPYDWAGRGDNKLKSCACDTKASLPSSNSSSCTTCGGN